jgi:Uma2 family endonuclease
MATELHGRPRSDQGLKPYRISVRHFERMIEAGVLPEQPRLELFGGVLCRKRTKNDAHDFTVGGLGAMFNRLLEPAWFAREEKSVVLGGFWRPEPDIAVVRRPRERYRDRAPRAGEIGLLVEVSDVTYTKDRGVKWRRYAAAGVGAYWIVNLPLRRIEVYSRPTGRGQAAVYQDVRFHEADSKIPLILDGREMGRITVKELLG